MLLYMNLKVTTNEKPIIDTHTKRERNLNITLKRVIKSQGKEQKQLQKQVGKTINKMAISTDPSITSLAVNGLNTPIK